MTDSNRSTKLSRICVKVSSRVPGIITHSAGMDRHRRSRGNHVRNANGLELSIIEMCVLYGSTLPRRQFQYRRLLCRAKCQSDDAARRARLKIIPTRASRPVTSATADALEPQTKPLPPGRFREHMDARCRAGQPSTRNRKHKPTHLPVTRGAASWWVRVSTTA